MAHELRQCVGLIHKKVSIVSIAVAIYEEHYDRAPSENSCQ